MGACCSKCCSKRSGVCRCAFRCPHLCSCSSCCVPKVLPETNLITPEDRWSNLPSSKQQILDEIGLVRIAPKDNTHPASDLRTTPFVAHLKVTIPTLGNAWLSDHPHVYKFAMQTSYGPTAPDRQIHDFSDESLDPFQEEFHFVIDRSRSVLHIALREPSFGPQAQKRCWGQGHKAHQWEMMIDGSGAPAGEDPADGDAGERSHGGASLVSFDETPSLDSIDSVCPEICEMGAADVSYGTTIREGANLVTLKPRPDSETGDIVIKIEYTPMRGTMDSGRCYGPGYVGLREGGGCCGRGAKNRLRFGLSENWLCAHDNVYVTNEARDCENNLTMLRLVEKLGISVDRDQMADSMYRQMSVGHGAAVEAKAQHNEQAINSSLQLLEVESESDTERELRASAGALFHHMNNRLLALESREANWRCDVHGEWFSSGSSLGAMAYMIVPLDQWHALRPEQDEETPSTKDPFWQNWDDAITLAGDRKNAGSFSIPLPYHHLSMPGIVTVRAFRDDGQFAAGNVFLLDKGTKLVVFDCDGTLTTGDHEVVTQFIVSTTYDPQRFNAAATMVRMWAMKGYQPVYLSGRQGTMYNWTMSWLAHHSFPPGPIHLTRSSIPTLPMYESVGKFKVEYLQKLQAKGLEVYAAYGNTETDIRAYEAAGIPKERSYIIGPHAGKDGSAEIENWESVGFHTHLKTVCGHPDAVPATSSVSLDWGGLPWGYDS